MVVEPAGLTRAGDCSGEIRMQDNKTARSPHHPWLQSAPKNDRKSIVVQIAVPRKFAGRSATTFVLLRGLAALCSYIIVVVGCCPWPFCAERAELVETIFDAYGKHTDPRHSNSRSVPATLCFSRPKWDWRGRAAPPELYASQPAEFALQAAGWQTGLVVSGGTAVH